MAWNSLHTSAGKSLQKFWYFQDCVSGDLLFLLLLSVASLTSKNSGFSTSSQASLRTGAEGRTSTCRDLFCLVAIPVRSTWVFFGPHWITTISRGIVIKDKYFAMILKEKVYKNKRIYKKHIQNIPLSLEKIYRLFILLKIGSFILVAVITTRSSVILSWLFC